MPENMNYNDIENIKYLENDVTQIELLGITYEKAIEAKAKVFGLPNLHILIGKSNDDGMYRALCLDSGIMCISEDSSLDKKVLDSLFREACFLTLNKFYETYKRNNRKTSNEGRIYNRKFWEVYDFFILKSKNQSLNNLFKELKVDEADNNMIKVLNNKELYNINYDNIIHYGQIKVLENIFNTVDNRNSTKDKSNDLFLVDELYVYDNKDVA